LVWYGVYRTTSKSAPLKVLFVALAEKFPEAQEKEILKVIGNLVYYKFINPAVIAPDKYISLQLL
jgi:hypothetical protein